MDTRLEVKVKTSQNRQNIELREDKIVVSLASLPEKGKANSELAQYLSKKFNTPVHLVSGFKSKTKVIRIEGLEKGKILELIREQS